MIRAASLPVPPSPLVGRESDLTTLLGLLCNPEVRLVTLTGPGGIGKTRLAVAAAWSATDEAVFVDLSIVRDPDLVVTTIAHALEVGDEPSFPLPERLAAALRGHRLLLVLDNFEQVVDAAPVVAELLATCPHLRVLATSREPLRIRAEHQYPVQPLAVPTPHDLRDLESLANIGALALFLQRARAIAPGFSLTRENAPHLVEICLRLEGVPLSIELAAARSKHLSPAALLTRLDSRLSLLTGGPRDLPARLQTMRDAIAWSYDAMNPGEQSLFRQLAVFTGGFVIEAARAVVAREDPESDIWEGVTSLTDKSLLGLQHNGEYPRYTMLETIREFGLEQLGLCGEAEDVSRRHANYFVAFSEEAETGLQGAEQAVWVTRIEFEHGNIRSALAWLIEREAAELALRLAGALWWFWYLRGYLSEGRSWLDAALAMEGTASSAVRAKALTGAGNLALQQGDNIQAMLLCNESLSLFEDLNDWRGVHLSLNGLANAAFNLSDLQQAEQLFTQCLYLSREHDDDWASALSLHNLGEVARHRGDLNRSLTLHEESLALSRALQNKQGIAHSLYNLSRLAGSRGDWKRAIELCNESIGIFLDIGEPGPLAGCLELLTMSLVHQEPARAARIFAVADSLRRRLGFPMMSIDRIEHDRVLEAIKKLLGDAAFRAAWADGEATSLGEAISETMAEVVAERPATSAAAESNGNSRCILSSLSSREWEVLRLIADGRTDQEIADCLFISPNTVKRHTAHIRGKLGVRSRAAAAALLARHAG